MSAPGEQEVREQLARILVSPTFARSPRLSRFLRFVTESVVEGRQHELKEYTVGLEVFDKDPAYDPQHDASVRVEARRLRYKLRDYYEKDGAQDPVIIDLPKGGFVPSVARRAEPVAAPVIPRWRWLMPAGGVVLAGLVLLAWQRWPVPAADANVPPAAREAYQNGVRARGLRTPEGRTKAAELFRHAVRLAPEYSAAWADLSQLQISRAFHYETERNTAISEAETAARRAEQLDAKSPTPHRTLAWVQFYVRHNWPAAEEEFRASLRLDGRSASTLNLYALALTSRGRFSEAIQMAQQAIELDPRAHAASPDLAVILYLSRKPQESLKLARQIVEVGANPEAGRLVTAMCLWQMGQAKEALAEVEPLYRDGERHSWLLSRMTVFAAGIDRARAERYLKEIDAHLVGHQEYHRAYALAALGRAGEAFTALELARRWMDADLSFLRVEPMFDPLRADPRFETFARSIGL